MILYPANVTPRVTLQAWKTMPVGSLHDHHLYWPQLEAMADRYEAAVDLGRVDYTHGVLDDDEELFASIRKLARGRGLPIAKQKNMVRDMMDRAMSLFSNREPIDLSRLPAEDLVELHYSVPKRDEAPDPITDALLERQQDPLIRNALKKIANDYPLQLYTPVGMAFYMNRFQKADRRERREALDRLLFKDQSDPRIIPFLTALLPYYEDIDPDSHLKALPRLGKEFPFLTREVIPKYALQDASFARRIFRTSFSRSGLVRVPETVALSYPTGTDPKVIVTQRWQNYLRKAPKRAKAEMEALTKEIVKRGNPKKRVKWREYNMIRGAHDERGVLSVLEFSRSQSHPSWMDQMDFEEYSTPALLDLLLHLHNLSGQISLEQIRAFSDCLSHGLSAEDIPDFPEAMSESQIRALFRLFTYLKSERLLDFRAKNQGDDSPLRYVFGQDALHKNIIISDIYAEIQADTT